MKPSLFVALMLAACSGGATRSPTTTAGGSGSAAVAAGPAHLPDGAPLVTPGEHMTYKLQLKGIDLASYEMAVGDLVDQAGKKAVVVQSHAKAVGFVKMVANVDDTFTSWIDVATGRSLRWTSDEYATKSDDKERTEARFAERSGDLVPMTYHVNDQPPVPEPQKVSLPETWDFNAFLVALRSWEGAPGTAVTVEVLRSRYLWHLQMTIHGKEKLTTALGDLPALRFDGKTYKLDRDGVRVADSDEREFSIWISDDDGRVPLKIVAKTDYGDMNMVITDYQAGGGQRLRN